MPPSLLRSSGTTRSRGWQSQFGFEIRRIAMEQALRLVLRFLVTCGVTGVGCLAQPARPPLQPLQQQTQQPVQPQGQPTSENVRPNYTLGPNDQITIRAFGVDEINEKSFRIGADGTLILPLVGTLRA